MKAQSVFLAAAERKRGMKFYLRYVFVNGVSFAFLSETVTILLAMQFGASNLEIGLISSAIYLTGIVSILVPALFGGARVMRFFFWTWLVRSLVCLGYASVLFVQGHLAVALILATYLLYCLLRNSAYFLNQVIMAALSKRSELGATSAKSLVAVNLSGTLSRLLSFGVLAIPFLPVTIALLILQGVGIILNTVSSFLLRSVPVRDVIERKLPHQLFAGFFRAVGAAETRLTLVLNLGGIMLLVLFTFAQPHLRGIGFPPSLILAFTVATALGIILSARFGQLFVDQFGSRPFLLVTHLSIAALGLAWALLPGTVPYPLWFALGFATMFFLGLATMLTGRLVLRLIPQADRVGFSAVLSLLAGLAALVAGVGGGLLSDLPAWLPSGNYGPTFLLLSLVSVVNALICTRLQDKGSASLSDTARVLFSPSSLQTFLSIDRLRHADNARTREETYLDIEYSATPIAQAEIRRRLHLPLMREKEMLIRSLFANPRPDLVELLVDESRDRHSWWRQSALFALGAYPGPASVGALVAVLDDPSPYMRSVAIKSLARIGHADSLDLARRLVAENHADPRTCLNAIIALSIADTSGAWLQNLFALAEPGKGYRFQQHVMVIASKRLGTDPGIEYFFYLENSEPGSGFEALIEETREILAFYQDQVHLLEAAKTRDFATIRQWCRQLSRDCPSQGLGLALREAVVTCDDHDPTASDTLALLYFSYQLQRDIPLGQSIPGNLPE